jgi:hypothetical protein
VCRSSPGTRESLASLVTLDRTPGRQSHRIDVPIVERVWITGLRARLDAGWHRYPERGRVTGGWRGRAGGVGGGFARRVPGQCGDGVVEPGLLVLAGHLRRTAATSGSLGSSSFVRGSPPGDGLSARCMASPISRAGRRASSMTVNVGCRVRRVPSTRFRRASLLVSMWSSSPSSRSVARMRCMPCVVTCSNHCGGCGSVASHSTIIPARPSRSKRR